MKHFEKAMEQAAKYLTKSTDSWVIDDRLIRKLEQEMEKLEQMELDEATKKVQREQKQDIIKVMKCLKDYADEKVWNAVLLFLWHPSSAADSVNQTFQQPIFCLRR